MAAVGAASLLAGGPAQAASPGAVLDQSTTGVTNTSADVARAHSWSRAQTFTAGYSGSLTDVVVTLRKTVFLGAAGNVRVAITGVTGGGAPNTSAELASATIAAASVTSTATDFTVTFSTPAQVLVGTSYAIVLTEEVAGGDVHYAWSAYSTSAYAGGAGYGNTGAGFTANAGDFRFSTYVLPPVASSGSRLGYCIGGKFFDLIASQPDSDPTYVGAVPAFYVDGIGITCDRPPVGFRVVGTWADFYPYYAV